MYRQFYGMGNNNHLGFGDSKPYFHTKVRNTQHRPVTFRYCALEHLLSTVFSIQAIHNIAGRLTIGRLGSVMKED